MNLNSFFTFLEKTSWLQQIAALLTIIGIPYAFLKLVIYKARHKIFFKVDETYHKVVLVDFPNQPWSIWLHLMVRNKGYEISKDVEAYLSEIWSKHNNSYKKLDAFKAPVKLKWAHEKDIHPIDILPKENRRLDVCFICQNQNILYLEAEGFPSGTIKNILGPGDYLFIIKVVSKNGLIPAKFIFNVIWDGQWNTIKGENYLKNFRIYRRPVKSFSIY